MANEKKIEKRLKGITTFFFIQPILSLTSYQNFNFISLGLLTIMSVLLIGTGFGLKNRQSWARISGITICTIQGFLSIVALVWFPAYFQQTVGQGGFRWLVILTEGIILLFVFVYFSIALKLNSKEMKEYFTDYKLTNNK